MFACSAPVSILSSKLCGSAQCKSLCYAGPSKAGSISGLRGRGLRLVAKASEDRWPAPSSYKLWPTDFSISSGTYNAIQGAELLFYAALVDAGFSGDWSRIGVLTTDQELLAQQAWWFILAAHSGVAAIAVRLALQEGYPALKAGVKGLVFGSLGLYDVYLRCELDKQQRA